MAKPIEKVTKEYPIRGPLKQSRFEVALSFNCFRCGQTKTAKLITIYNNDWDKRLCNGCYGRLLSIYEIKAGEKTLEEKTDELSQILLKLATEDSVKQQTIKIAIKHNQANLLSQLALRFFATSEVVAATLTNEENLDWSPAIIGLCKAIEPEIIEKYLNDLKDICSKLEVTQEDIKDKDYGKVASYCFGKAVKSPELGAISHFTITAINSKERLETSIFLNNGLKPYLALRPNSGWLIDKDGLALSIDILTKNFRNKAAHTDELGEDDYKNCKNLIFGEKGIMWELIHATKKR